MSHSFYAYRHSRLKHFLFSILKQFFISQLSLPFYLHGIGSCLFILIISIRIIASFSDLCFTASWISLLVAILLTYHQVFPTYFLAHRIDKQGHSYLQHCQKELVTKLKPFCLFFQPISYFLLEESLHKL